jgi:hypothetical protein
MAAWVRAFVNKCSAAIQSVGQELPTSPDTLELAALLAPDATDAHRVEAHLFRLGKVGALKLSDKGVSRVFANQSLAAEVGGGGTLVRLLRAHSFHPFTPLLSLRARELPMIPVCFGSLGKEEQPSYWPRSAQLVVG